MGAQAALDTSLIVLWSCVFKTAAQTKNTWVMNLALPFLSWWSRLWGVIQRNHLRSWPSGKGMESHETGGSDAKQGKWKKMTSASSGVLATSFGQHGSSFFPHIWSHKGEVIELTSWQIKKKQREKRKTKPLAAINILFSLLSTRSFNLKPRLRLTVPQLNLWATTFYEPKDQKEEQKQRKGLL